MMPSAINTPSKLHILRISFIERIFEQTNPVLPTLLKWSRKFCYFFWFSAWQPSHSRSTGKSDSITINVTISIKEGKQGAIKMSLPLRSLILLHQPTHRLILQPLTNYITFLINYHSSWLDALKWSWTKKDLKS